MRSTVLFGSVEINGPMAPTTVETRPRYVTDIAENGATRSYEVTTIRTDEWTLEFDSITASQKAALQTFFVSTAAGPTNSFSYTHTDDAVYSARFVDAALKWQRQNENLWAITIRLELVGQQVNGTSTSTTTGTTTSTSTTTGTSTSTTGTTSTTTTPSTTTSTTTTPSTTSTSTTTTATTTSTTTGTTTSTTTGTTTSSTSTTTTSGATCDICNTNYFVDLYDDNFDFVTQIMVTKVGTQCYWYRNDVYFIVGGNDLGPYTASIYKSGGVWVFALNENNSSTIALLAESNMTDGCPPTGGGYNVASGSFAGWSAEFSV